MNKNKSLIGREKESAILQKALQSNEAEMVAVIGRRRVGKTFLVRTVYESNIKFDITGVQNVGLKEQLNVFSFQLKVYFDKIAPKEKPESWLDAFQQLIICLENSKQEDLKPVLFFDELPWLASRKSGFLNALSFFWNNWAVKQNIIVVICGSAASWMIQQVVNHKGGLHNRITHRINLMPFNLYETTQFLESKNVWLDHYQCLQIYMAMGGIPHYLKEIEAGKSAAQNIEKICFSSSGLLSDEFSRLYVALFENAENHINIIKVLSKKWMGLTRQEIITETKIPDGGNFSRYLEELVHSGFISVFSAFGKKQKDALYRLTDEYSLFYLQFMENKKSMENDTWLHLSQTQSYKNWSGYAFENICLKHANQIKKALGISGIYSEISSFYHKGNAEEQGVQIDLLIDRNDKVINLFELKFYSEPFALHKNQALALRQKISSFKASCKTSKQVFLYMLSTFGVKSNEHSIGLIQQNFTMEVLFEKI